MEIIGKFEYILWQDNATKMYISRFVDDEGKRFCAKGIDLPTSKNSRIRLTGEWQTDRKGRESFNVVYHEIILPTSEKGVQEYLRSLKCGIGRGKAIRLYKQFGENIWEIIDKDPQQLTVVKGISQNLVNRLVVKLEESKVLRNLMRMLMSFPGLTLTDAQNIHLAFGDNAEEIITKCPYELCAVQGIGFERVDAYALKNGTQPNDKQRLIYMCRHILSAQGKNGHSCYPLDEFIEEFKKQANNGLTGECVTEDDCRLAIKSCCEAESVKYQSKFLYLISRYEQECRLTGNIEQLLNFPFGDKFDENDVEKAIAEYEFLNFPLADAQKQAIRNVFFNNFSVVCGGAGTGKTTTIKAILFAHANIFGEDSDPVLLAPTGRAARRMSDATGYPASTIHSAVHYIGEEEEYDFGEDDMMLEGNLFIIDETSMMDLFIGDRLMNLIPSNARVVFIGDPNQLPSVGCGNVLADMIKSKVIPVTELEVNYRVAEGNPIISNAVKINKGETSLDWCDEFQLNEARGGDALIQTACSEYLKAVDEVGIDNTILLCPYRNKSECNVNILNIRLQELINPPIPGGKTCKGNSYEFRIGDKVMQMKNTPDAKNGDVGYIKDIIWKRDNPEDEEPELFVQLEFNNDGIILEYSETQMQSVELAYASTVHKSQGEEYKKVIFIVSDMHSAFLRRNVVYTGVTRAKEKIVIVGSAGAMSRAILDNRTNRRYTTLASRLQTKLKKAT